MSTERVPKGEASGRKEKMVGQSGEGLKQPSIYSYFKPQAKSGEKRVETIGVDGLGSKSADQKVVEKNEPGRDSRTDKAGQFGLLVVYKGQKLEPVVQSVEGQASGIMQDKGEVQNQDATSDQGKADPLGVYGERMCEQAIEEPNHGSLAEICENEQKLKKEANWEGVGDGSAAQNPQIDNQVKNLKILEIIQNNSPATFGEGANPNQRNLESEIRELGELKTHLKVSKFISTIQIPKMQNVVPEDEYDFTNQTQIETFAQENIGNQNIDFERSDRSYGITQAEIPIVLDSILEADLQSKDLLLEKQENTGVLGNTENVKEKNVVKSIVERYGGSAFQTLRKGSFEDIKDMKFSGFKNESQAKEFMSDLSKIKPGQIADFNRNLLLEGIKKHLEMESSGDHISMNTYMSGNVGNSEGDFLNKSEIRTASKIRSELRKRKRILKSRHAQRRRRGGPKPQGRQKRKNRENRDRRSKVKMMSYQEVTRYAREIAYLDWGSIDPWYKDKMEDKYICGQTKTITANVLWFLVCSKFFDSAFWEDDLIRKITHKYYQETQESLPAGGTTQIRSKSERKQYETIMLMDLQIIQKNKLLKLTDFRKLSRVYNFLKTKRGIKGRRRRGLDEMYGVSGEEAKVAELCGDKLAESIQIRRRNQKKLYKQGLLERANPLAGGDGAISEGVVNYEEEGSEVDREKELALWEAKVFREMESFRFKETKKHKQEEMPWAKQIEQMRFRVRLISWWHEHQNQARDQAIQAQDEEIRGRERAIQAIDNPQEEPGGIEAEKVVRNVVEEKESDTQIKMENQEDEQTKSDSLQGMSDKGEVSLLGAQNFGKIMGQVISPNLRSPEQIKGIQEEKTLDPVTDFAMGTGNETEQVEEHNLKIDDEKPRLEIEEKDEDEGIKVQTIATSGLEIPEIKPFPVEIPEIMSTEELIPTVRNASFDESLNKLRSLRVSNNAKIFSIMNSVRSEIQKRWQRSRIFARAKEDLEERLNPSDNFYNQNAGFTQQTDLLRDLFRLSSQEKEYLKYMEGQQKRLKQTEARIYQREGHVELVSQEARRLKQTEIVCQICTSGDYSDNNQIVFCSKCNVSVHQLCYGMATVPKCDWVCQLCLDFEDRGKYMQCPLCTCRGGVMKPLGMSANDVYFKGVNSGYYDRFNYRQNVIVRDLTVRKENGNLGEIKEQAVDSGCAEHIEKMGPIIEEKAEYTATAQVEKKEQNEDPSNLEIENPFVEEKTGEQSYHILLESAVKETQINSNVEKQTETLTDGKIIDKIIDKIEKFEKPKIDVNKNLTENQKLETDVNLVSEIKEPENQNVKYETTARIANGLEFSNFDLRPLESPQEYETKENQTEIKESKETYHLNQIEEEEVQTPNQPNQAEKSRNSLEPKSESNFESENKPKIAKNPTSNMTGHPGLPVSKHKGPLAMLPKAMPYLNPNLYYNFYLESFVYPKTEIELNQPTPSLSWIHLTCGLWMPEIFMENKQRLFKTRRPKAGNYMVTKKDLQKLNVDTQNVPRNIVTEEDKQFQKEILSKINLGKYQLVGLKDLTKSRFGHSCGLCFQTPGATMECYRNGCTRRFHIECAKRARLTLESQNLEHREYVIYCEAHTPLKFKKELEGNCKKARNQIVRFAKTMKREIKTGYGIELLNSIKKEIDSKEIAIEEEEIEAERQRERRLQLEAQQLRQANRRSRASKRVRAPRVPRQPRPPRVPRVRRQRAPRLPRKRIPKVKKIKRKQVRYTMMEKIACLSNDDRKLLNHVKKELGPNKDYFFVWDVNLALKPTGKEEENFIHETIRVNIPKKNILNNRIIKNNSVWKRLSGEMKQSSKKLHEKHMKIVTYIKNKEEIDDKVYCVCKKKWDGKLMVECETCNSWYHPECIGIFEKDDVKLNMMYILCKDCRAKETPQTIANGHIRNPIKLMDSQEILESLQVRPDQLLVNNEDRLLQVESSGNMGIDIAGVSDVCDVISKVKWEKETSRESKPGVQVIGEPGIAFRSKMSEGTKETGVEETNLKRLKNIGSCVSETKNVNAISAEQPILKMDHPTKNRDLRAEQEILNLKNNSQEMSKIEIQKSPAKQTHLLKQRNVNQGPNMTSIIIQEELTVKVDEEGGEETPRLSTSELAVQQNQRVQQLFKTNYDRREDRERLESVIARFKPNSKNENTALGKRNYKGFCKKNQRCLKSGNE